MDNGPSLKQKTSLLLQEAGELCGDPFEMSTIRREVSDWHSGWHYDVPVYCITAIYYMHSIFAIFALPMIASKWHLSNENPCMYMV